MFVSVVLASLLSIVAPPALASPNRRWIPIPYPSTPSTSIIDQVEPIQHSWSVIAKPIYLTQQQEVVDPPIIKPPSAQKPASTNGSNSSRWITGLGAGARIGFGEPTYAEAYGRIGYLVNEDIGLSIRPRYIVGNSDLSGEPNREGAFQIPLTLDLKSNSAISPYFGAGIATNTDSTGEANGLLSGGIDFRIFRKLRADASINYIFESYRYDNNGRDIEGSVVLYYVF